MTAASPASAAPGHLTAGLVVEQCWQPVPGGSGRYVVHLARELHRRDDVAVVGLAAAHRHPPASADLDPGVPTHHWPLPRRVLYDAWDRLGRPRAEGAVRDLDVVHAATWAVPATRRPLVVTVHDTAFRRNPEHFTARGVGYFSRALEHVRRRADVVLVPSAVTRADCLDAGIDADRVRVVPLGVEVPAVGAEDVAAFRRGHALSDRPYLLWVGTREPRKNLRGLLAAFALAAEADPDLVLVVAGPVGWGDDGVQVPAGLADRVVLAGRLDEASLHAAYAGARAFCFPSLWEGFGLPALEAMAHGVPVVTSAGTSMAEVAQGAAILVDPRDPAALADGIARATGSGHAALAAAGLARAAGLTWARTAAATVDAYRDAVARHR